MSKKPFTTPSLPTSSRELQAFPSPDECLLLSKHVYQKNIEERSHVEVMVKERKVTLEGWKVHKVFNEDTKQKSAWLFFASTDRHKAVLYTHTKKKQMVLAFKGIDPMRLVNIETGFGSIVNKDIDGLDFLPALISEALEEAEKMEYGEHKPTLSFTGHSLGGFLAQISTFVAKDRFSQTYPDRHFKAFTFEAPGARDTLEQMNGENRRCNLDNLDVTNYLSSPNIINCCSRHVGSRYRVIFERFEPNDSYNMASHDIDNFFKVIDVGSQGEMRYIEKWPKFDVNRLNEKLESSAGDMFISLVTGSKLECLMRVLFLFKDMIAGQAGRQEWERFFLRAKKSDFHPEEDGKNDRDAFFMTYECHYQTRPFYAHHFHGCHIPDSARNLIDALCRKMATEAVTQAIPALRYVEKQEDLFVLEEGFDARYVLDKLATVSPEQLEAWCQGLDELKEENRRVNEENRDYLEKIYTGVQVLQNKETPTLSDVLKQLIGLTQGELNYDHITKVGLKLYVTLQGSLSPIQNPDEVDEKTLFDLDKHIDEFLRGRSEPLLLLQGNSGAGKSLYGRYLERKLWKKRKKTDDPIPVFISLPSYHEQGSRVLLERKFQDCGLDEAAIRRFKSQPFVFILDGFDEIKERYYEDKDLPMPFYERFKLNQWKNSKFVLTCRTNAFVHQERQSLFAIGSNVAPQHYLVPFSQKKVHQYIKKFVSSEDFNTVGWTTEQYEQSLDHFAGLQEMIRDPFSLNLILKVLPRLKARDREDTQISRAQIYEAFTQQWFDNEIKRIGRTRSMDVDEQKKIRAGFVVYCQKLAFNMLIGRDYKAVRDDGWQQELDVAALGGTTWFEQEDSAWQHFFTGKEARMHLEGSPLYAGPDPLNRDTTYYQFIHKSYQEYFAATYIARNLMQLHRQLKRGFRSHFEKKVKDYYPAERLNDVVYDPLINRVNLVSTPAIIQFLVDLVLDKRRYAPLADLLFDIIESSKKSKNVTTASANAITILNGAGFSFAGKEWAGIRIIGANLDHAMLSHANLQGAELMDVSMRMAYLEGANLQDALLMDVNFGEYPYLEHPSYVMKAAWANHKMWLASASENKIYIWNFKDKAITEELVLLTKNTMQILSWSPNDKLLACVSMLGQAAYIWDVSKKKVVSILRHNSIIMSLSWSPKSKFIATGSQSDIKIWDIYTRKVVKSWEGSMDVSWSHNGKWIAYSEHNYRNKIYIYEIATGKKLCLCEWHKMHFIKNLSWSPNDKFLAVTGDGRSYEIQIWDRKTGFQLTTCKGHTEVIYSIAWSHNGKFIASAGGDKTIRIYNPYTGLQLHVYKGHFDEIGSISWSSNDELIASSGGEDQTVRIWDAWDIITEGELKTSIGHGRAIRSICWSPSDRFLASVGNHRDLTLRVWDMKTGQQLYCKKGFSANVFWASENQLVDANGFFLWEEKKGKKIKPFEAQRRYISKNPKGGISPNHQLTATVESKEAIDKDAYDTYVINVRDSKTNVLLYSSESHKGELIDMQWSHDSTLLAYAGNYADATIRIWDSRTGKLKGTYRGHHDGIHCLSWSHNNHFLASAGQDYTIRIWDVATGKVVRIIGGHGLVLNNADFRGAEDISPIYKKLIKQRGGRVDE